jgi:hypothetical protein
VNVKDDEVINNNVETPSLAVGHRRRRRLAPGEQVAIAIEDRKLIRTGA